MLSVKYSGYHRKIYGKFLAITLYRVIIPKVSAFCPKGVDYPENVSIINSWAASYLDEGRLQKATGKRSGS
jgi:hypothetical protein